MKLVVRSSPEEAGRAAAGFIAERLRAAVAARGVATLAVSGGSSPVPMFEALALEDVPWRSVHVFQTDERVAPRGSAERNLPQLEEHLVARLTEAPAGVHAMPVETGGVMPLAYEQTIERVAGAPAVLDVVHLGLGADGHTASLVPNDAVLDVQDTDVAMTEPYRGLRRMTLTFPAIDRARGLVWLVTGVTKGDALARLVAGDGAIPAGRVVRERAVVFADRAAAFIIEQREPAP